MKPVTLTKTSRNRWRCGPYKVIRRTEHVWMSLRGGWRMRQRYYVSGPGMPHCYWTLPFDRLRHVREAIRSIRRPC